jgi:hypothetical protein
MELEILIGSRSTLCAFNVRNKLFLKATARRIANFFMNGFIVRADDGLGFVAPKMAGQLVASFFRSQRFFNRRHDEHFFCPQMFAECLRTATVAVGHRWLPDIGGNWITLIHGYPFNLSSVRRINACAIGTL